MNSTAQPRMFYGWKLSYFSCFANLMIQGGGIYLMNAFIQPFSELYNWSRGDLGNAMGIGSFCGMVSMPLLATLGMHVSLRVIMTCGAFMGGLALLLLGQSTNLWVFTLSYSVIWVAGQACGGVVANALMSNWFVQHRGRAFGIANAGVSASGAILPFVALLLIKAFTVQTATTILGAFLLLTLFPASWLLVRDTPESMGMSPDGKAPAESIRDAPAEAACALSVRELLHSPQAYRIGLTFAVGLMAVAGVVGQLKPRFSDLGFDDYTAMAFMCGTAFFTALGKYLWGWIADRYSPLHTTKALLLYNICAFFLAFLPPTFLNVSLFAVICGLGIGGFWTCLPAVVAEVYGRTHFMSAYRVICIFIFLKSFGYVVMGQAYQMTGSYDAAFVCFIAAFILAFFLLPWKPAPGRPESNGKADNYPSE